MKVQDLIQGQSVVTARLEQTAGQLANLMRDHGITGVPIVDEWGALAGLVTVSTIMDLVRGHASTDPELPFEPAWSPSQRVASTEGSWRDAPARDVMVTDLCTVLADDEVKAAARAMVNRNVHRAVVLGPDRNVTGIVSSLDFTRLVAEGHLG